MKSTGEGCVLHVSRKKKAEEIKKTVTTRQARDIKI